MPKSQDPTEALKAAAETLSEVVVGTSCNQSSYKVGKQAFLYVGPGPKGVGFKAMFKLEASLEEAQEMSDDEPDRFEVGAGNWVTVRFTREKPLPKRIWNRWLKEAYAKASSSASSKRKTAR